MTNERTAAATLWSQGRVGRGGKGAKRVGRDGIAKTLGSSTTSGLRAKFESTKAKAEIIVDWARFDQQNDMYIRLSNRITALKIYAAAPSFTYRWQLTRMGG